MRIIGGKYRGRKLNFPARPGLRPTLGRTRETLFNWVLPMLPGARCLDLFAGSGALGLEALSRGAAQVLFVEQDRAVADALAQNLERLDVPQAQWALHRGDAETLAPGAPERFDLIFLDPPFAATGLTPWLTLIDEQGWLAPDGLIYFEQARSAPPPAAPFETQRLKHAGTYQYGLLRASEDQTPPAP